MTCNNEQSGRAKWASSATRPSVQRQQRQRQQPLAVQHAPAWHARLRAQRVVAAPRAESRTASFARAARCARKFVKTCTKWTSVRTAGRQLKVLLAVVRRELACKHTSLCRVPELAQVPCRWQQRVPPMASTARVQAAAPLSAQPPHEHDLRRAAVMSCCRRQKTFARRRVNMRWELYRQQHLCTSVRSRSASSLARAASARKRSSSSRCWISRSDKPALDDGCAAVAHGAGFVTEPAGPEVVAAVGVMEGALRQKANHTARRVKGE